MIEAKEIRQRSRVWWAHLLNRRMQLAIDLVTLAGAFVFAYLLRFDFDIPFDNLLAASRQLPYVLLIQFGALALAGVYSFIWRYIGMAEVRSFINAGCWSLAPILFLRVGLPAEFHQWRVPFSIIFLDAMLAFAGVLGVRVLRRALYERYEKQLQSGRPRGLPKKPVLLIGAGRAGVLAAREIRSRGNLDIEVKGFVDDDTTKQGSVIYGMRVLGKTADLPALVEKLDIDHVVITVANASGADIRRIVELCERIPIRVRIIPALYEILQGNVEVSRIRDVQIEDLLGREPVQLDQQEMRTFLAGRVVMVTGAGGSIGSELARQTARFGPAKLVLVERAEFALFNIDRELRDAWPDLQVIPLVADIGDAARMRAIFQAHHPQVVLHAAAHKHVPMMESNITEAVKNNVVATRVLGSIAGDCGTEAFVLISTDKAVRPTSIMGATKRVAELVIQNLNRCYPTRFVAVRFGNVIGSAGSVIPIFREQIRKGGPVTVTHPEMVRYFMTIPEASQLVLQAGAMGEGGEIFVLDMGQPVRILDLARDLISLSGLRPHDDIAIVFTGVRPGEKLFEELAISEEWMARTRHSKIFIGKITAHPADQWQAQFSDMSDEMLDELIARLSFLSDAGRESELRRCLGDFLPEAQFEDLESPCTT